MAVALLVTAISVGALFSPRELTYKGLSFQRVIELRGPQEIEQAVFELGPEITMPYLVRALVEEDSWVKKIKLKVWPKLPRSFTTKHLEWIPIPAQSSHFKIYSVLIQIGPAGRATVPALIRHARGSVSPQFIIAALSEAGRTSPEAFQYLCELARSPDERIRSAVDLELGYFRDRPDVVLPLLMSNMLAATSSPLNEMLALSRFGTNAAPAAAIVLRFLPENGMPGNALTAFRSMGPDAAIALPWLVPLAAAGNALAIETLMNIGPGARDALPALSNIVVNGSGVSRALAATAIARITGEPQFAVPILIEELQARRKSGASSEPSWSSPWNDGRLMSIGLSKNETAAWLLGELGPAARDAVPALTDVLTKTNQAWLPSFAARSLRMIDSNNIALVLPRLVQTLNGRSPLDSQIAARVLGEMGAAAAPAEPALRAALTNTWPAKGPVGSARREINDSLHRLRGTQVGAPTAAGGA